MSEICKAQVSLGICLALFMLSMTPHAEVYEADAMMDWLNVIRAEKFDHVLPQAMRDNNVDMWIHVMGMKNTEEGHLDPLRLDLGGNTGFFIFTDRGAEGVERAAFGRVTSDVRASGAYEILGRRLSEQELRQFVAERDPKRIAVNYSDWMAVADGISHRDYLALAEALGEDYEERFVSADDLITSFRSGRVMSEIVFYGELCRKTVEVMEKAFDTVEPGVTTLGDVARWLRNQNMSGGFGSVIQFGLPGVFCQDLDGNEDQSDDHVIRGGDVVHIDFGLIMMNYRTDIKRIAYITHDGETVLPEQFQRAFDEALRARDVLRKTIKVGRTSGETLALLERKLEEADFLYSGTGDYLEEADPVKTRITLDLHPLGHGWGDEAVGPRMASWGEDRANIKIPMYNLFVLEYMINVPVPEWGEGKRIYLAIEDDVTVTERGVEFLHPPIKEIRVIR